MQKSGALLNITLPEHFDPIRDLTLEELKTMLDSYTLDQIQELYQQHSFDEDLKLLLSPYLHKRVRQLILPNDD